MKKNTKLLILGAGAIGAYLFLKGKTKATTESVAEQPAVSGYTDLSGFIQPAVQAGQNLLDPLGLWRNIANTVSQGVQSIANPSTSPTVTVSKIAVPTIKTVAPTTNLNLSTLTPFAAVKTAQQTIAQSTTLNVGSVPSVVKSPTMNVPIIKEPQTAGGTTGTVTLLGFKPTNNAQFQAAATVVNPYRLSSSQQLSAQRLGLTAQEYAARYL